jgi:hypothetical protein
LIPSIPFILAKNSLSRSNRQTPILTLPKFPDGSRAPEN